MSVRYSIVERRLSVAKTDGGGVVTSRSRYYGDRSSPSEAVGQSASVGDN